MADIASLSVKLGLVTVEWDAATEKAKRQAKDLKAAFDNLGLGFGKAADMWRQFGSIISVSAMTALVTQTAAFADEIIDIGKSFDLTTQQVLSFRDALSSAGVNADGATKILSTLYSKIDEGRQGNDKTIAQFEKLGITYNQLKNLDTYEAIQKVASGFENVADSFERVKMIKEFFGKGGVGVSIEQINEALAQGTTRYDEYADALKKVGVISDNLKRSMDNLKIAVAQMIAPFSQDGIISINNFHRTLTALVTGGIVAGVLSLGAAFWKLAYAIKAAQVEGALFNLIAAPVNPIGIAIRLLAAGATAIVFFAGASDNKAAMADEYLKNPAVADQLKRNATKNLLFTKEPNAKQETETTGLSKEAQQKSIAIGLARQQLEFENQKYAIALASVTLGERATALAQANIARNEKISAIDAKRKEDLNAQKDGTATLKKEINTLADVEIAKANAEYSAKEKLINQTERLAAEQRKAQEAARNYAEIQAMNQEYADYLAQQPQIAEQIRIQYRDQLQNAEAVRDRMKYEYQLLDVLPREKEFLLAKYDLEAQITQFKKQQKEQGVPYAVYNQQAEAMRRIGEEQINLSEQTKEHQRTFQYGWNEAYQSYMDNATNAANTGRDAFNSVTQNMNSALDKFVRTGKLNFKSLAQSIIQDLIKIKLQAQATKLFDSGGNGIGDFIQKFMGGMGGGASASSIAEHNALVGSFNMPRADGGSVDANKIGLVGERGPELFIPKTAGTIIPNNRLGSMGGGQTINYNGTYIANMSAIDTQSGTQFLAKNKNTIWAAYQSANRGVPVSR